MYDIHNHVLPGVDDGAANMQVAIRMLEQAIAQGITHVACTPHLNDRATFELDRQLQSVFLKLQDEVQRRKLSVELQLGSEIMLGPDLKKVLDLPVASYGGSGRYMLLEFPPATPHEVALNSVITMRRWAKIPVLAHVERYVSALKTTEHAKALRDAGAVLTLDGGSLFGQFGDAMTKRSRTLVKEGLIDVLCSDAHDDEQQGFCMKRAYDEAAKLVGKEHVDRMVLDHPRRIWENQTRIS